MDFTCNDDNDKGCTENWPSGGTFESDGCKQETFERISMLRSQTNFIADQQIKQQAAVQLCDL
jgi:hypothetical protein